MSTDNMFCLCLLLLSVSVLKANKKLHKELAGMQRKTKISALGLQLHRRMASQPWPWCLNSDMNGDIDHYTRRHVDPPRSTSIHISQIILEVISDDLQCSAMKQWQIVTTVAPVQGGCGSAGLRHSHVTKVDALTQKQTQRRDNEGTTWTYLNHDSWLEQNGQRQHQSHACVGHDVTWCDVVKLHVALHVLPGHCFMWLMICSSSATHRSWCADHPGSGFDSRVAMSNGSNRMKHRFCSNKLRLRKDLSKTPCLISPACNKPVELNQDILRHPTRHPIRHPSIPQTVSRANFRNVPADSVSSK